MLRRNSVALILVFLIVSAQAQTSQEKNYAFLKHLERLEAWNEGLVFLEDINTGRHAAGYSDTLNYLQGKFHYKLRSTYQSISYLKQVSVASDHLFRSARFFTAFQEAYNGQPGLARTTLLGYDEVDTLFAELKTFQLAGLDLLDRKYDDFEQKQALFGYPYQLETYEKGLFTHYERLTAFKSKSKFVAGALSTLLPGGGKFYLGKTGEGIATLLVTGIFGLQTWEGYRKDGLRSPRFIIFGTLFTVSHFANILGAVLAVKVRREEFNAQINDSILLDMHIPLRVLLD